MPTCRLMLLVLLLISGQTAASEITVEEWVLSIGVIQAWPDIASDSFREPSTPFSESHEVELENSLAGAAYDFAWDDSGGTFLIQSWLEADILNSDSNVSTSYGRIKIRPTVDLAVHVDASFDYNLPTHLMEAMLDVYSGKYQHTLFSEYREHDTLSDGIGSGTLSFSGNFVMPADELWNMSYNMQLRTDDWVPGAVGQIATGSGNVSFTIQAVPEPGTLSLALLSSMMLLCRRKPRPT